MESQNMTLTMPSLEALYYQLLSTCCAQSMH